MFWIVRKWPIGQVKPYIQQLYCFHYNPQHHHCNEFFLFPDSSQDCVDKFSRQHPLGFPNQVNGVWSAVYLGIVWVSQPEILHASSWWHCLYTAKKLWQSETVTLASRNTLILTSGCLSRSVRCNLYWVMSCWACCDQQKIVNARRCSYRFSTSKLCQWISWNKEECLYGHKTI